MIFCIVYTATIFGSQEIIIPEVIYDLIDEFRERESLYYCTDQRKVTKKEFGEIMTEFLGSICSKENAQNAVDQILYRGKKTKRHSLFFTDETVTSNKIACFKNQGRVDVLWNNGTIDYRATYHRDCVGSLKLPEKITALRIYSDDKGKGEIVTYGEGIVCTWKLQKEPKMSENYPDGKMIVPVAKNGIREFVKNRAVQMILLTGIYFLWKIFFNQTAKYIKIE